MISLRMLHLRIILTPVITQIPIMTLEHILDRPLKHLCLPNQRDPILLHHSPTTHDPIWPLYQLPITPLHLSALPPLLPVHIRQHPLAPMYPFNLPECLYGILQVVNQLLIDPVYGMIILSIFNGVLQSLKAVP